MSKRSGSDPPAGPVRLAVRVVKAATRVVEEQTALHDRQLALAELWRRALTAEADLMKLLGTGEPPDFPMAATPGELADPAAAVAVIDDMMAIFDAAAAEIIKEEYE
jgi:outer membrane protein TolC